MPRREPAPGIGPAVALTERRQRDREIMAAAIAELAERAGARTERIEGGGFPGARAIQVTIHAARGANISIDLDGYSCQPDVFVQCWNIDHEEDACFAKMFGIWPGEVNASHYRKSQFVAHGFAELLQRLERDLERIKSGTAFCAERERHHVSGRIAGLENALDYYRPIAAAGLGTTFHDGAPHQSPETVAGVVAGLPGQITELRQKLAAT